MSDIKNKIQVFGKFLSGMVMPNIGAFIAWGLITAFFIPTGWFPNETFAQLVEPMIKYLLPILIAYTGGKLVGGTRGGVIGAISSIGVIAGSSITMFIGAMIVGPISGYLIKKFDKFIEDKIPSGFEMLVNNFSIGIFGLIFSIISLLLVGPVVTTLTGFLSMGVSFIIGKGLLPLVSIFIEPAKVLFLNNAINHGILSPIGIDQVQEAGKSVLYLLETNPGPGLGVILAYLCFSKGMIKQSATGAAIIHFLGGIHEIYFPYILMNPILILAVILGGAAGVFIFSIFSVGLVATPSPGSIFAIMALSAKGDLFKILLGIFISALVSFLIASFFIKKNTNLYSDEDLNKAKEEVRNIKSLNINTNKNINKIVFACDAGMGSSAMGASKFRNKLKNAGINLDVSYCSVDNIPSDCEIIVTHENLKDRVLLKNNKAQIIVIKNFLNDPNIENLFNNIVSSKANYDLFPYEIFNEKNIVVDAKVSTKEEAIKLAGKLLFENGYIDEKYIEGMLQREKLVSTHIGMGVSIPHGEKSFEEHIKKSGIVLIQVRNGVDFGDEKAYLIFGIACKGEEHIKILSNIALLMEDYKNIESLINAKNTKDIMEIICEK